MEQNQIKGRIAQIPAATRWLRNFIQLLVSRFMADQALPNAASLTFTTLLSLVPLMSVILVILSAFAVGDRVIAQLQNFVFENFLPASSEVIYEYLNRFSENAGSMTGPGLSFLIVVALLLMAEVEHVFNRIWRIDRTRPPLNRFLVYWAILTLGPLLIGLSVAVTSYLISMPVFSVAERYFGLGASLFTVMPVVASATAFSLLYLIVPNQHIRLIHAITAGVFAALLFELTKHGFAFYITYAARYEVIYGALAAVPLFLIWVYLGWAIALLGAEFCCCLEIAAERKTSGKQRQVHPLLLHFRILRALFIARKRGEGCSIEQLQQALNEIDHDQLAEQLNALQHARYLAYTEGEQWLLARDLSTVSLLDLYHLQSIALPEIALLRDDDPAEQALKEIVQRVRGGLSEEMSVSLETLFREAGFSNGQPGRDRG